MNVEYEYTHKRTVADTIKIVKADNGKHTVTVNGIRVQHANTLEDAIAWAKDNYADNSVSFSLNK